MPAHSKATLYNRFRKNIASQRVRAVREYLRHPLGENELDRLNNWPTSPLQDAITTDNAPMVHLLMLRGANAAYNIPKGGTPLLNQAIQNAQFLVACTMVHASADLDAVDCDGATALHETFNVFRCTTDEDVKEQALIMADMLVFNGAKTDVCDASGNSVNSVLTASPNQEGFALFKRTMLQHQYEGYYHQT